MRRNFACSVACLVATFMLEAACFSVYATQRAGQWVQRRYGSQRADVVEIFGGHSQVSMEAAKQGWLALQPYDSKYGCDLSDPEERDAMLQDLDRLQPRLAIVEFPCTYWSQLQNINYGQSQQRRRLLKKFRKQELPFLQLCEDVFMKQLARGDDALAENPVRSAARLETPIRRLEEHSDTYVAIGDMCRHNLRHARDGGLLRKRTWWCCTSYEMYRELNIKCEGGHEHSVCFGGNDVTSKAGRYTPELSRAILRGFRRTLERKEPDRLRRLRRSLERRISRARTRAAEEMIYLVGKLPSWETYAQEHDGNKPGASSSNDGITFEFSRPELGRRVGPAVRSSATTRQHGPHSREGPT